MKAANGNIVRYFEALKDDKVAMTINGDGGTINRIEVRDRRLKTDRGVQVGTRLASCTAKPWSLVSKGANDNGAAVERRGRQSAYQLRLYRPLNGPEELMPFRRHAENWKVSKIIWRG